MNSDEQGHHELSGKSDENKSFKPNQIAPSIYIMIELCFFSLDQWEIKIHLLWGKCFNIPHWPRSHSTNRRLQHIEKLSKTYSGDPHLDQTKLNGLLLLTIHGVLMLGGRRYFWDTGYDEDLLRAVQISGWARKAKYPRPNTIFFQIWDKMRTFSTT